MQGFSLHAAVRCGTDERQALEQPCLYITRPALANERVQTNAGWQVVRKLEALFRDGATHLVKSPLEFRQPLPPLLPRARLHLIRFGVRITAPREVSGPRFASTAFSRPAPSCARWWCRNSPRRLSRKQSPPSARRTARAIAECG